MSPSEAPIRVALYENHKSPDAMAGELTWDELFGLLSDIERTPCAPCADPHECPSKFGQAWSPVVLRSARRANANVVEMTALVLDFDGLAEDAAKAALSAFDGLACIAHTTHSHRPREGKWSFRVAVRLTRPVPAGEWRAFLPKVIEFLGVPADPACKDLSRLYFLPSICEAHAQDAFAIRGEGEALDPSIFGALASRESAVNTGSAPAPRPALGSPEHPVDLAELLRDLERLLRKYRREADKERAKVLADVLAERAMAQPGERDARIQQAASIVASCWPANTPVDAFLSVVRPSLAAMECEPEGQAHWEAEAGDCYERAMARRLERDAERERQNNALRENILASMRLRGAVPATAAPESSATPEAPAAPGAPATNDGNPPDASAQDADDRPVVAPRESAPEDEEMRAALEIVDEGLNLHRWQTWLKRKPPSRDRPDEPGDPISCAHNAGLILRYDDLWRGKIRFNEVSKQIEVAEDTPVDPKSRHTSVLGQATSNLLFALHDQNIDSHVAEKLLLLVARCNAYDPLGDDLRRMAAAWDGEERIDTALETYCGAVTDNDGHDLTEYVREVSGRWFTAAAVRGLKPGEKVDNVLVLEGRMGRKKSTFFDVLGGAFFSTQSIALADKDTKMVAGSTWIVELAEMESFRRAERQANNAFLTTRTDKYRPPYGASLEDTPRRCVFVGTTEDDDWLASQKGSRRYWPVRIERVDVKALRRDREQLWGEAATRALRALAAKAAGRDPDDKDRWWMAEEAEEAAVAIVAERLKPSGVKDAIEDWWFAMAPAARPKALRAIDVARNALHVSLDRLPDGRIVGDVGDTLGAMGFKYERVRGAAGKQTRMWTATQDLLTAPQIVRIQTPAQTIAAAQATR